MFKIEYKHQIGADGMVSLEYYKCVDTATGDIVCELVDGELVWRADAPNDFVHAIATTRIDDIMSDWFLEYYGLKNTHTFPVVDVEEWAKAVAKGDI